MLTTDDLAVALAELINATLRYEEAWSKYVDLPAIVTHGNHVLHIAKEDAHKSLLKAVRNYRYIADLTGGADVIIGRPAASVTIQPAIETSEARNAE